MRIGHDRAPGAMPGALRRLRSGLTLLSLLQCLLAAIALSTATLFFALFAFGNKMHLLAEGFGDALGNNNLVEATKQLINGLAVASFYSHISGISTHAGDSPGAEEQPVHLPPAQHYGAICACTACTSFSIHARSGSRNLDAKPRNRHMPCPFAYSQLPPSQPYSMPCRRRSAWRRVSVSISSVIRLTAAFNTSFVIA